MEVDEITISRETAAVAPLSLSLIHLSLTKKIPHLHKQIDHLPINIISSFQILPTKCRPEHAPDREEDYLKIYLWIRYLSESVHGIQGATWEASSFLLKNEFNTVEAPWIPALRLHDSE